MSSPPAQGRDQLLHWSSGVVNHTVRPQGPDQGLGVGGAGRRHVGPPGLQELNTHVWNTPAEPRCGSTCPPRPLGTASCPQETGGAHRGVGHTWMANVPTPPDPPRINTLWRNVKRTSSSVGPEGPELLLLTSWLHSCPSSVLQWSPGRTRRRSPRTACSLPPCGTGILVCGTPKNNTGHTRWCDTMSLQRPGRHLVGAEHHKLSQAALLPRRDRCPDLRHKDTTTPSGTERAPWTQARGESTGVG